MQFGQWLSQEIRNKGWTEAEFARQGGITAQAVNQAINQQTQPGLKLCQATARAFKMPLEEVYRLAGLLPARPARRVLRVRDQTPVYEVEDNDIDQLRAAWERLTPDARALLVELAVRLAAAPPKIIE